MKPVEAQLKQIKKEFEKKKWCDPKKLDLGTRQFLLSRYFFMLSVGKFCIGQDFSNLVSLWFFAHYSIDISFNSIF